MRRKVDLILKVLDEHFPNPPIPLDFKDPYTFLIAVLLSAQCTDERVNKTTPALFALAGTPEIMAKQEVEVVEKIIRSLGLAKTKANAIVNLSKILVEKYDGKIPDTLEKLKELPGVGHKTASVIMCQIYNVPAFPVDTHIHRLAKRWGLSNGKSVVQTEKDLKKAFPKSTWIKLHLQLIMFGRTHCVATRHIKQKCPLCLHL